MKVGVIGAGTMGQGIAKAFAQTEGFTVALCDIKQEWADKGKDKIAAGYAKLVAKGKLDQAEVDRRMAAITAGLKEDLCADCDLIVEAAFEMCIRDRVYSLDFEVTPHLLRHTYITNLIHASVDPKTVQRCV